MLLPIRLLTAGLSVLVLASAALSAATINVRDYGGKGDGVADDSGAINAAIADGAKAGPGTTVLIPAGRHLLLNKHSIKIRHANGLTVTGETGTIIIEDDPNTTIVDIDNCNDTTFKSVTIEQSQYHFTQGKVIAQSPAGHFVDIVLDPGFPEVDDPLVLWQAHWCINVVADPTSGRYEGPPYFGIAPKAVAKIGERTWRLTFSDFKGWPSVKEDINIMGKRILIWNDRFGGHGIGAGNCKNLTIDAVTYYGKGANAILIMYSCTGKTWIKNCRNTVEPGSKALLSCSGGGQFVNIRDQLVFENCDFEHFDDDGADVLSDYRRIIERRDGRTIVVQNGGNYLPGDHMTILDGLTYDETVTAKLVSSTRQSNGNFVLVLDKDLPTLHVGAGDDKKRATDGVDRICDYDSTPDLTVAGCIFQCNRARPLNLKARRATIAGCTFKNGAMPAIAAGPEMGWGEAPTVHHYTISGCTFTGIRDPSIEIGIFDVDKYKCEWTPISDILITGNTFDKYGSRGAIEIRNARNVTLAGNTFGKSEVPLKPGVSPINFFRCEATHLYGNTGQGAEEITETK